MCVEYLGLLCGSVSFCIFILYWSVVALQCCISFYNVALVSSVQQDDSVLHAHISILFQILFCESLSIVCLSPGPVSWYA